MAKQIAPKQKAQTAAFKLAPLQGNGWFFTNSFLFQSIIIVLVGTLFYFNTKSNLYALDDDIIMKENMFVQKGFSGIGDILSNDAYKSYYQSMGVEQQLEGGRYRPLSVITFAVEQSLFGKCYGERFSEVRDSIFILQRAGETSPSYYRLLNEKNALDKKIKETNLDIAPIRHVMQVMWYVLAMVILLWFLRECIFRGNTDIAFLTALLFTIHPIHTEVVANVKSRDEIFSLMFICLTFIFFFRYDISRKAKDAVWGSVHFFLALLSKEYAIVLLVLVPAGLMIFHKRKVSDLVKLMLPLLGVVFVYWLCRHGSLGDTSQAGDNPNQDPLNDPYMYAKNPEEKLPSIINRLDDYLWLLFFPYPLVSDYSYQHFPYSTFGDPWVWLSLVVNLGLVVLAIRLWIRRHPMAFALMFYFAFFLLINNVLFDVGATMGERLMYHSSLGFCMGIAWLLVEGLKRLKFSSQEPAQLEIPGSGKMNTANQPVAVPVSNNNPKGAFTPQGMILLVFLLGIGVPAFLLTVQRNKEWRDDYALFTHDVIKHPNSALTNGNAGARYMDYGLSFLGHDTVIGNDTLRLYGRDTAKVHRYADTAIFYLARATTMHDRYANGFLNLGLCYYYKDDYQHAAEAWGRVSVIFPSNPILLNYEQMLIGKANERASKKDYAGAAQFMYYAATAVPTDAKVWADYAGASFMARDFTAAKAGFQKAMSVKPEMQPQLQMGYSAASNNEMAVRAFQSDSTNPDSVLRLARAYTGTNYFYPESRRLLNKTLQLRPGDNQATRLLDSLGTLEKKMATPPPPAQKPKQ